MALYTMHVTAEVQTPSKPLATRVGDICVWLATSRSSQEGLRGQQKVVVIWLRLSHRRKA